VKLNHLVIILHVVLSDLLQIS